MAGIGPTGLGGIGLSRSASARLALALLLALALVRGLEEARAEDGAERGADPVDGNGRGLARDETVSTFRLSRAKRASAGDRQMSE